MLVLFVCIAGALKIRDARRDAAAAAHRSSSSQANHDVDAQDDDTAVPKSDGLERFRNSFNGRVVRSIAPRNWKELIVWLGLSVTAGFCEEHIFRGYLLQQALACGRMLRMREGWLRAVAVVLTGVVFGSMHLYEGFGGAAMITLLGAVYAVAALRFGNLRAVIVAHALQDFLAGLVLMARH